MRIDYRVAATSHDELKAAAAEIASKYAGDLEHTVTIEQIGTEWRSDPKTHHEIAANDDPAPRFVASCFVEVADAELDAARARDQLDRGPY